MRTAFWVGVEFGSREAKDQASSKLDGAIPAPIAHRLLLRALVILVSVALDDDVLAIEDQNEVDKERLACVVKTELALSLEAEVVAESHRPEPRDLEENRKSEEAFDRRSATTKQRRYGVRAPGATLLLAPENHMPLRTETKCPLSVPRRPSTEAPATKDEIRGDGRGRVVSRSKIVSSFSLRARRKLHAFEFLAQR